MRETKPIFREGQLLQNKYIRGRHFKFVGYHPDMPDRVIVTHSGEEITFYANEMETV